jgi:hypothetical protein
MLSIYTSTGIKINGLLMVLMVLQSCGGNKVYKSNCDVDKQFQHISFTQLLDSLPYYDNRYVEVSGKYKEGKGLSALVNDSLFVDHSEDRALWVEFSQDCPLYLSGTDVGFFDYSSSGQLTPVNNKVVLLRGKINFHYKGHLGLYKGAIEHVSYVRL